MGAQIGYLDFSKAEIETYQDFVDNDSYPTLQYILTKKLQNSEFEKGNELLWTE